MGGTPRCKSRAQRTLYSKTHESQPSGQAPPLAGVVGERKKLDQIRKGGGFPYPTRQRSSKHPLPSLPKPPGPSLPFLSFLWRH